MTVVVNMKQSPYDVNIQRGSRWGNPFKIGVDGTRVEVIAKYYVYILEMIKRGNITLDELMNLKGKRLGCTCKPKLCHGDVLVELINLVDSPFYDVSEKSRTFGFDISNFIKRRQNEY